MTTFATPGAAWQGAIEYAWGSYIHGGWGIGAVILDRDDQILSGAGNRSTSARAAYRPAEHAEVGALESMPAEGAARLLVSTVEPCVACLGALVLIRFPGVEFGARDLTFTPVSRRLQDAAFIGGRLPRMAGPRLDAIGAFCRLLALIAERENGHTSARWGLENRLTPQLTAAANDEDVQRTFTRLRERREGWCAAYTELEPCLALLVPELQHLEARLLKLGLV